MLGRSDFYKNSSNLTYPLTGYTTVGTEGVGEVGLPNGGGATSGNLSGILNIGGFQNNSIVNIIALQSKYFFQDCWAVNLSFGMNIGITPKKDYVESTTIYDEIANPGGPSVGPDYTGIPAQKYVNAQTDNNWFVNIGVDRYFATKNPRINPYVGVVAGFQMARISTVEPYTGVTVDVDDMLGDDDITKLPLSVFRAGGKVGQMMGITGAAVAGVEYALTQGLYLGIECRPLAYRYDFIQLAPQGFESYNLSHHNIKIMDMPVLKLGVRF